MNLIDFLSDHFDTQGVDLESVKKALGLVNGEPITPVILFQVGEGGLFEDLDQARLRLKRAEFEKALNSKMANRDYETVLSFIDEYGPGLKGRKMSGEDRIIRSYIREAFE